MNNPLDIAVAQLSPYLTEFELDKLLDIIDSLRTSKWEANLSASDAVGQIKLVIGNDRYEEVRYLWSKDNQKILTEYGKKKYRHKKTGQFYDGLDPTDDQSEYQEMYI